MKKSRIRELRLKRLKARNLTRIRLRCRRPPTYHGVRVFVDGVEMKGFMNMQYGADQ
jgi:hypothetical protein